MRLNFFALMRFLRISFVVAVVMSPSLVLANQASTQVNPICGTWKLLSVMDVDLGTHQAFQPYGRHPQGYLNYLPDGHMAVIMVSGDRLTPSKTTVTAQEAAKLYSQMTSYSGTYTLKSNQIIHHVEVAWNPRWTGSDQVRDYKIQGNHLTLTMNLKIKKEAIHSILVWERAGKECQNHE
ncbi:MAG: lipocalin-like domain-containing protein [Legionellales bacterium]|nr:lipocalin-like domain-containing protein [Legionellales bacterium]